MTINEKKQLTRYIKGLVRESIRENEGMPDWWNRQYGEDSDEELLDSDSEDYPVIDEPKPGDEAELDADPEWERENGPIEGEHEDMLDDEDEEENIAGLNELRRLTESMARSAVMGYLMEKKKSTRSKDGKKKGSKQKSNSAEKTIVSRLNNDAVNSAHYFYKLYGVEDGTEDEKAAARSLGYKKAKGKKLPGKKGNYKFSSKERNRLNAMLTTDKN